MKHVIRFAAICLLLTGCRTNFESEPVDPTPAAKEAAKVLIVTGVDYPGHPWKLTAPVLARAIQADERLTVTLTEKPADLAGDLSPYDVIVLHFMDWEVPDPGPAARANLKNAVAGGKGMVMVHFACGAFQEWPEFVEVAGRVWDPKLRGHDPHGKFTVNVTDAQHPVMKGIGQFETVDELYTCLAGDTPIKIIAEAKSKVDNKIYPMAFVLDYGKGRVMHSVLGHDVRAFAAEEVKRLFRNACAWGAGLEPAE